jgi:hypothetical protein
MKRLTVAVVTVLSALGVALGVWEAVAPFVPHEFWGDGRHANGTELEPEELRLLRRLGNAAGVAYETVDVFALREQNEALQLRVRVLEAGSILPSSARL